MTRINCVPVTELTGKHLVAEYRELPRVRHAWPRKGNAVANQPKNYVLGKGHVKFFYTRGIWIQRRHRLLIEEMRRRGYTPTLPPVDLSHWPEFAMNDWQPTTEALAINRERIALRISESNLRRRP